MGEAALVLDAQHLLTEERIQVVVDKYFKDTNPEIREHRAEQLRCRVGFNHFISTHCKIQDRETGAEIPFVL